MKKYSIIIIKILFLSIILISIFSSINCLGKYCSSVNRDDLFEKFENCTNLKNYDYSSSNPSSYYSDIKQKYQEIVAILDKVLTSINDGNSSKNETKHLFLDILRLVKIANSHSKLKFCASSICTLFKHCEFQ